MQISPEEILLNKIMKLSQTIWEGKITTPMIDSWLSNFDHLMEAEPQSDEPIHALFLLSNFMYFGGRELRELLRSLYRDKIENPLMQVIRKNKNGIRDLNIISTILKNELSNIRFLGVGNPSESGTHLLYYFRQVNNLSKKNFINAHEIFKSVVGENGEIQIVLADMNINTYIFIDDLCGSGKQVRRYTEEIISLVKKIKPTVKIHYYCLFGQERGINKIRSDSNLDFVDSVFLLDESFKCFSDKSRYFLKSVDQFGVSKSKAESMCKKYGEQLVGAKKKDWLGYDDSQMLLGFAHNTPNNTLPIIWKERNWVPIFKRYSKIGGN